MICGNRQTVARQPLRVYRVPDDTKPRPDDAGSPVVARAQGWEDLSEERRQADRRAHSRSDPLAFALPLGGGHSRRSNLDADRKKGLIVGDRVELDIRCLPQPMLNQTVGNR